MTPKWNKLGPKMAQDSPRWPKTARDLVLELFKIAQDSSKMAQDSSKMAPVGSQDGPRQSKMAQDSPELGFAALRMPLGSLLGPLEALLEGLWTLKHTEKLKFV